MKKLFVFLAALVNLCSAADTTPQQGISIPRYLGRWYEQARYENWFENGMDHVYTDYTANPDGSIKVLNCGREADGETQYARGKAYHESDGVMEVSFVWPYWWFSSPYHILYVDKDYQAALVSGKDDDYLWLLTRKPVPAAKTIEMLKREAKRRGFDTTKLRYTKH